MSYRPPIWNEESKRIVAENNRLRHKLRQLAWHDTIVLTEPLEFIERTYPVGAHLKMERGFDQFRDNLMVFVDEQGRTVTIDGWHLAEHGQYTKIDAPSNEAF